MHGIDFFSFFYPAAPPGGERKPQELLPLSGGGALRRQLAQCLERPLSNVAGVDAVSELPQRTEGVACNVSLPALHARLSGQGGANRESTGTFTMLQNVTLVSGGRPSSYFFLLRMFSSHPPLPGLPSPQSPGPGHLSPLAPTRTPLIPGRPGLRQHPLPRLSAAL